MRKPLGFIFILLIMLVTTGFYLNNSDNYQSRSKILKFSHRLHIEDAELSCEDCHENVPESTTAEDRNLPEKDICESCHDVEEEEECVTCHVDLDNLEAFAYPEWNVYFSHSKHVTDEKINCDNCHTGIEKIDMGDGKKIPRQKDCNTCHDGLNASMNCLDCHPMDTKFRPENHVPNWTREHMVQVRSGGSDCAHCHTMNYCQECHEFSNLISTDITIENFYAPNTPQAKGDKNLVLKSVHELNYRFVHQLDALGKEKDCQTCHEMSTYCSECHNNFNLAAGLKPAWHGGPDWGALAIGVGTGGGRHAELARRDIERCAACHDVQGADPTCLLCHTDFDGIKHTDPKTHDSDFLDRFGEGSAFHHDDGSICFSCHTNTRQSGLGFCGYCHGVK